MDVPGSAGIPEPGVESMLETNSRGPSEPHEPRMIPAAINKDNPILFFIHMLFFFGVLCGSQEGTDVDPAPSPAVIVILWPERGRPFSTALGTNLDSRMSVPCTCYANVSPPRQSPRLILERTNNHADLNAR